jgi:hypothetical protein
MRQSIRCAVAAGVLALTGMFAAPSAAQVAGVPLEQEPNTCMRQCLERAVENYVRAMVDGKVSPDLFAPDVRFTENGVQMPFGNEGLWATASGVEGYRLIVPDEVTGQVAALLTVREQGRTSATGAELPSDPVGISLRLRVGRDGKITEVEQIVARPDRPLGPAPTPAPGGWPPTGQAVDALGKPWEGYLKPVPEGERHTRAELVEMANAYFEAVERNTGKDYYPFTDDCVRIENGNVVVSPPDPNNPNRQTCKGQFETSLIGVVTGVRERRIVAVDEERGVVFAFAFFDHRNINWTWQLGELFKVDKGNISRIEAIFIRGPYGMCSGWGTYEQCRSEEPLDVR